MFRYNAKVVNVVDGDTFDIEIDLGFHIKLNDRVRLAGIDTPELNSSDPTERKKAHEAKAFVVAALNNCGFNVVVETAKPQDKYGRYLARVQYLNSEKVMTDLTSELITKGLGKAYSGGAR
jgi:micrococcal nuclease